MICKITVFGEHFSHIYLPQKALLQVDDMDFSELVVVVRSVAEKLPVQLFRQHPEFFLANITLFRIFFLHLLRKQLLKNISF